MTTTSAYTPDSRYAWIRLIISLVLAVVGGIGLWLAVVVLPTIQAEFGVDRAGASFPYTATFLGFAAGGFVMGSVADKFGITVPIPLRPCRWALGFFLAALSQSYWQFVVVQAVFIGFLGSAATFGPLVADASQWFLKRRGIAIAIVASGNYIAGTIWPPFMQASIERYGWRATYMAIGVICVVVMVPLRAVPAEAPAFPRYGEPGQPRRRPARACCPATRCCFRPSCWRACPAASPCRCRRSTSSPIALTSAMARRAAPRCCRSCWASAC